MKKAIAVMFLLAAISAAWGKSADAAFVAGYRARHDCAKGSAIARELCHQEFADTVALLNPSTELGTAAEGKSFLYGDCLQNQPHRPENIAACAQVFHEADRLWADLKRKQKEDSKKW